MHSCSITLLSLSLSLSFNSIDLSREGNVCTCASLDQLYQLHSLVHNQFNVLNSLRKFCAYHTFIRVHEKVLFMKILIFYVSVHIGKLTPVYTLQL